MLQTILNIYYTISGINICLTAIEMAIIKRNGKKGFDAFECMKEIEQALDEMGSERFKEWVLTFIDRSMENHALYYTFIFTLCTFPIVHIFYLLATVKSILDESKNDE